MLHKILKIGLEFEFNLPNKNGTCKGDNNACPCRHMANEECWKECVRAKDCEVAQKGNCFGLFCAGFLSYCVMCDKFDIDCSSCEHRYDPSRNPDSIRERMGQELRPSQSYGNITKNGVHSIVTDGSLLGKKGAEVITVGRRPDYWEFFKMSQKIIDLAVQNNAYVNERCSIHAHLLASYYGKLPNGKDGGPGIPNQISELEKEMPEIILANFHQLCRRYQNAMTWMTMGLDELHRMTRWEKFRVSCLHISAIMNSMQKVVQDVSANAGGNKYGWVNYNYCQFNNNGALKRIHVEMRVMDGLLTPSAVAAFSCLYYALMIKAVEISRYGVVEVGDKDWLQHAEAVKETLLNNMKGYQDGDRFGDTSNLAQHYETLISESFDLISQVKHILMKIGPAYEVLEKLAEKPCSLRRCDGDDWAKIEADLAVPMTSEDHFTSKLAEIIDLRLVDQCTNEDEWIAEVGNLLRKDRELAIDPDDATVEDRISEYTNKKKNDGEMVFLDRVGSMALI
ncbi:MAG: hypothetical protein R3356_02780 [Eudoraea sp.]|nr:hypothetical protein [Eudoraea sp.]